MDPFKKTVKFFTEKGAWLSGSWGTQVDDAPPTP